MAFVMRELRTARPCCLRSEDRRDDKTGEDASACNTSMVLLSKGGKTLLLKLVTVSKGFIHL